MEFFLRKVYPWLIEISSFSICIPLLVGVFLFTKKSSLLFRLLLAYTAFIAITEVVSQLTVYLGTTSNLWISHIDTPVEFALTAAIYYFYLEQRVVKNSIVVVTTAFILFNVFNVFWGEGIEQLNSLPHMVGGALLISMAVLYFYQSAQNMKFTYLDRDPMFLLSSGIIIYQAGTAVAFSMFNEALAESYDAARMCITVILVLNILFRIVLMLALKRAPVA